MANLDAVERHVYRLATLLTGSAETAIKVVEAVVAAQPDLKRLDRAHLDRLTVLRSREVPACRLPREAIDEELASRLAALPPQQRETWIFVHVEELPLRDTARATDCSVTAATRHLELAESALHLSKSPVSPDSAIATSSSAGATGSAEVADRLRAYVANLDVPAVHRQRWRRRRRIRRVVRGVVVGVVVVMVVLALRGVWG